MEPDGDMEQLFIAPTGEDSEGRGGEESVKKKQRGAERRISEGNMSQPAAMSMLAVRFDARESIG